MSKLSDEELKEYMNRLIEAANCDDYEQGHISADEIVREILIDVGYPELAKAFDEVNKWYA